MSQGQRTPINRLIGDKVPMGYSKAFVAIILLMFAGLLYPAYNIQVSNRDFYLERGEARYARTATIPAHRGRIFDRNGIILAANVNASTVWAQMEDFREMPSPDPAVKGKVAKPQAQIDAEIKALSQALHLPLAELRKKMQKERGYVALKPRINAEEAEHATDLGFSGIHVDQDRRRDYPHGETLSQIVGITNLELTGTEGIERSYNSVLTGKPGSQYRLMDRKNRPVQVSQTVDPQHGSDIYLSIDNSIQFMAYQRLRDAVQKHKAESGSIVMLDAQTGEVLAMANYPSFQPQDRKNIKPALTRNPAVMDMYEPGSSMKPLTVALALHQRRVTPKTVIATGNGRLSIGGSSISDTAGYGDLSVAGVIQKSSNVGTVKIADKLQARDMWEFFTSVGIGQKPDLKFPSTASGILRDHKSWRPIEKATISYGYGVSASLLQMAQAYTIFCADGFFLPATLEKRRDVILGERIITSEEARQMREMMHLVTQKGGTARQAAIEGYSVGGKTGTVRTLVGGRYATNLHSGFFVGFAPVSNPRVIAAVMIRNPREGGYFGGTVAAPVFSDAVRQALQILHVQPDMPSTESKV